MADSVVLNEEPTNSSIQKNMLGREDIPALFKHDSF